MLCIVVIQVQDPFFINTAEDFNEASGQSQLFFAANVKLQFIQQLTLRNAQVNCLMHTVTAESPPFDVVGNVTIRNCVFYVQGGLSNDFNNSALIGSTVISNGTSGVFERVSGSLFHGVHSRTARGFATNITNSTVVGCSFQHAHDVTDSVTALFDKADSSQFHNSFFNMTVIARDQRSVAGLIMECRNTSFLRVRAISSVTAFLSTIGDNAGGLISQVKNSVQFKDTDLLVRMNVSYTFADVGAVMSVANIAGLVFLNVSLVAKISVGMLEPGSVTAYNSNIGSLCGMFSWGTPEIRSVSAFVDIVRSSADASREAVITGLTGKSLSTAFSLVNCYVFGTIAVRAISTDYYYVAGISAYMQQKQTMDSCAFIGSITSAAGDAARGTNAYVGALGVKFSDVSMSNLRVVCNISVEAGKYQVIQVAGLLVEASNQNMQSIVVNSTISAKSDIADTRFEIGGIFTGAGDPNTLSGLSGQCQIDVAQASGAIAGSGVALLATNLHGNVANCSLRGSIAYSVVNSSAKQFFVVGIAAAGVKAQNIVNVSVSGVITCPNIFKLATGFGTVGKATKLANVFVAIAFPDQTNVNLFQAGVGSATASGIIIDCGLAGNNASQEYCRTDLRSQATADALGTAFGWKMEYNDGYPYLVNLPVWDGAKYVLPESGPFSAEFYYVDGLGYPFPNSDYQICRGACYGTYESPLVRNCTTNTTNTNNNSYCIQPELAETDFQTASCIQENAQCNSGASICTSEAEMKLNQTDSTYNCELGCIGCVNGYCQNSTCVCNLYYSGINCSTYQCDSDSPACFGDPTMQCAADGSGCVPTDACAALGCVHGSCVINSSSNKTQCRCDNMWTGSRCDRCNAYGPECSVSQSECNRLCGAHGHCGTPLTTVCTCALGFGGANCGSCAADHTAVGDSCVCGDSGGPCQLRQTCVDGVCVADCLLADPYCAECEAADQRVCSRCVKQHTIQDGICQFYLSAAVSTSFAVVLGVALFIVLMLGAVLLFRLWKAKKNTDKAKPATKGDKSDTVQSGPKLVEKIDKPLLKQIAAEHYVSIEVNANSASGKK